MESNFDFGNIIELKNPEPDSLKKMISTFSKWQKDFDSLAEHIAEGLARCEIICNSENVPVNYRILSTNRAFEKHTGLTKELCVGKTILDIMPDAEKSWIETYGRVALTQKAETITGYNKYTKRYYRSTAYSDKYGEFMMLFEDITHQKELEKAYELVNSSLKVNNDLLSNMPEGYKRAEIICDENNNPIDFRILEVNKAYQKQTGIEIKNYVGKTILEVFPDVEKSWIQQMGEVALTGNPKHVIDYNHNTRKYYEVSAFCPKIREFSLFIKDVTDREKSRIKLEEAYKKVEESEQLKSAFLANMSHEIRSPLNAILGFTDLMDEKALTEAEKEKCLTNIKNSGNRLLTLISDILDISKLEANQQQLKYETHNLNEIIDRLFDQFSIGNHNSSVKIETVKAFKDEDAFIFTDSIRLQQIFSNLIENAIKQTEDGLVSFGYKLEDDFLEFFVSDTGKGIAKENQTIVFERFRQIKDKTTFNQGVGLGIPIAAGFANLFGGKMWLDSELGKGSTFYFTIPYQQNKAKSKSERPVVLVAEDEEANFMLLEMWMGKFCDIVHAHDGNDAVKIAKENKKIDLILMDIKMPHMDGIEATKQIRQFDLKIPIIALTAFVMDDEKEQILKAGCNQLLPKPIKRDHFKKLLTSYVPDINLE